MSLSEFVNLKPSSLFFALCTAIVPMEASAVDLKSFDVTWSGTDHGNNATATAQVTLDMDLVRNPGVVGGVDFISAFSITVENATTGNGSWDLGDYDYFELSIPTLDFSRELVGQNGWGVPSNYGFDFKVGHPINGAPGSNGYFRIGTNEGSGDRMGLTSFKPATPTSLPLHNLELQPDFSPDQGHGVNDHVYALAEDSEGRLVVGGKFGVAGTVPSKGIARFLPGGEQDGSLAVGTGITGGVHSHVSGLVVLPDDSIIAVGDFTEYDGTPRGNIVKVNPDGQIAPDFANGLGADAAIRCIERLPDGTFLIGGEFEQYDGEVCSRLARLDQNGNLDSSFDTEDGFGEPSDYVDEIELLEDGKALVAGRFYEYGGHPTRHVARILANGDVDTTFESLFSSPQGVGAMKALATGKILLGSSGGGDIISRLEEDGAWEYQYHPEIFGDGVHGLLELADGRVIVSGEFESFAGRGHTGLIVIRDDGSIDMQGFKAKVTPDSWVGPLILSANGNVHAGGAFTSINGLELGHLARFAGTAFTPDVRFASATASITEGGYGYFEVAVNSDLPDVAQFRVTVESDDGSLLSQIDFQPYFSVFPGETTAWVYCHFRDDSSINTARSFRLRISPDSEGATVGTPDVITITVVDDDVAGTVFLEKANGVIHEGRGSFPVKVKRHLNDPGSRSVRLRTVDGTALAGRDYQAVDTAVAFPAGVYEQTIHIGGPTVSPDVNPLRRFTVELYDPAPGTLVGSPGTAAIDVNDRDDPGSVLVDYTIPDRASFDRFVDLARDPNGILYGLAYYSLGSPSAFASKIIKFPASGVGQVFATVPTGGIYRWAEALEFGLDDKLYVSGAGFVLRYRADGSIDDTWINPIPYVFSFPTRVQCLLPLPDGKLMIAGYINDPIGGVIRRQVARLMPDGTLDESFDLGANIGGTIYDMALDISGRILIAGNISSVQGVSRTGVARVHPGGTLDLSFNASAAISTQGLGSYVSHIAVAPDGKIFLSGSDRIIRVNGDGTHDQTFAKATGSRMALQPDGKLLVDVSGARRVGATGQTDESFNPYPSTAYSTIELGPDGRIHVAGSFTSFDGLPAPGVATILGGPGSAAGKLVWESEGISVGEGIGTAFATLRRVDSTTGNVGIHYTVVAGTADAGDDVEIFSGYQPFAPGETEHEIGFNLPDDSLAEGLESFHLVLHDPSGGAGAGPPGSLKVDIIDDDGIDLASWISRHYPANPADPSLMDGDQDGDGVKTFVEWMTDSDPTLTSDAKKPVSGWLEVIADSVAENHFGITFYLNPSKTGYRTVVERSDSLSSNPWDVLWDSDADPLLESDLISGAPLEGAGWISVHSPHPTLTREFLRLRYEKK